MTPCFNSAHILPTFFDCLRELEPQPDLYVFAENNSVDGTLEMLWNFELPREVHRLWLVKDAAKRTDPYVPMAHIRQVLLTRARRLNPDYIIFCDVDVFVRTPDAIDVLTTWQVDCVAARIIRIFPKRKMMISAKWKYHEGTPTVMRNYMENVFDDTPVMVGFGLVCLSRRVIQDRRINFYPLPKSKVGLVAEDFGYCLQMREYGYKCCLEGIVIADHVVYDEKNRTKAWTKDGSEYCQFEYP